MPVPPYNFARIPVVLTDPYHYGEDDAPAVADLGPKTLALTGAVPAAGGTAEGSVLRGPADPRPPIV